jgi:ATP-dependent DNA ligase
MDCFDVLIRSYVPTAQHNGKVRRGILETLLRQTNDPVIRRHFLLNPRYTVDFERCYRDEPEGLILKPIDEGPYEGGGERVKHWIKVKKDHTVDMVVMGYEPSTAETKIGRGLIEHLTCGMFMKTPDGKAELVELTKTGGMTEEMQFDITTNWERKYLHHVVELKHFGQFRSGALRHPSVVRMRPDKRAVDCVFDPKDI